MSEDTKSRVIEIIRLLKQKYPEAKTSLDFETPFQLLIATILSAQCTDKKVNEVTKTLFQKYPGPAELAKADMHELEEEIHATGFYHQKAKSIVEASQDIMNEYGGKVPDTMEELIKLRGVGRKTGNVVLGNAFGKPGMVVDTHVLRISGRLGIADPKHVEKKDADKIEKDLMEVVPENEWTIFSHLLVYLGRDVCTARNPKHEICPVLHLCPTGQAELKLK